MNEEITFDGLRKRLNRLLGEVHVVIEKAESFEDIKDHLEWQMVFGGMYQRLWLMYVNEYDATDREKLILERNVAEMMTELDGVEEEWKSFWKAIYCQTVPVQVAQWKKLIEAGEVTEHTKEMIEWYDKCYALYMEMHKELERRKTNYRSIKDHEMIQALVELIKDFAAPFYTMREKIQVYYRDKREFSIVETMPARTIYTKYAKMWEGMEK
jgi:hypothetical protein